MDWDFSAAPLHSGLGGQWWGEIFPTELQGAQLINLGRERMTKIKICANSWVANSLEGERWKDQGQEGLWSWYANGLMGVGTKCEDLCVAC